MKAHNDEERARSIRQVEFGTLIVVCIFAVFAVIAFGIRFHSEKWGDADSWGWFGDFFGGIVNPVVGLATVFLVLRTLHAAQSANDQMAQQITNGQNRDRLGSIKETFGLLLAEWKEALVFNGTIRTIAYDNVRGSRQSRTSPDLTFIDENLGDLISGTGEAIKSMEWNAKSENDFIEIRNNWRLSYSYLLPLIFEMHDNIRTYDDLVERDAGGERIDKTTDYYRRRFRSTVHMLARMGFVEEPVHANFCGDWGFPKVAAYPRT